MKFNSLLAATLCILLFTSGCFILDKREITPSPSTTLATPLPTTENRLSTTDPAAMALQLTDIPGGYIIRERADLAYQDISPLSREQGWKQGYIASFYRMNAEKYDITAISQRIGVYNINNIHLVDRAMAPVFDSAIADILSTANATVTVTELPFPKTGDQTTAYRITDTNDAYGVTKYVVIFTKNDVIELIEMRGTTTDYETLKGIVTKAAAKIR